MTQSVVFIVSSVTGNQLTRAYPFASLLRKSGRRVKVIGPGRQNSEIYIQDPDLEIYRMPTMSLRDRVNWIRDQISDFDIVCVCKPCWEGTIADVLAKHSGKKLVYDIDDDDLRTWFFDLRKDAARVGLLRSLRNLPNGLIIYMNFSLRVLADRVLVASEFLRGEFGGEILYVPVDASDFHPTVIPGNQIIMYAGAIRAHKGIEALIDAFSIVRQKLTESSLFLVGPVEKNSLTWKMIQKKIAGIPGIRLPGKQPIQSIPEWLSKADCLVIPSPDNPIHRAQSPVKLMYYMAAGRPIVATPVGEVTKILEHGRTGLIAANGDPVRLAELIVEVMTSPQLSNSIARIAREEFLTKFSSEAVLNRISELYTIG